MTSNTKSSVTLPPHELALVNALMKQLKAKSKVEVIRRGLALLKASVDRASLRASFQKASAATKASLAKELAELDALTEEGLD